MKLMMTDPVDNYLLAPSSDAFVHLFNLRDNFLFITPDSISYAGVLVALVAAKLVSQDSLSSHRLSFVLFQLRTWLDDLDGALARARMGIHEHVSLEKTRGYVIDGTCDGIGFVAYLFGCYVFLRNAMRRNQRSGGKKSCDQEICFNLQSMTELERPDSIYIPVSQDCTEDDLLVHDSDQHDYSTSNYTDLECRMSDCEDRENLYGKQVNNKSQGCSEGGCVWETKSKSLPRSKMILEARRNANGNPSSFVFFHYTKETLRHQLSDKKIALINTCFLLQVAVSALFWNRYIIVYRNLLESPSNSTYEAESKRRIIKSNFMYIIIWFWRLTNGHSLMQMLATSVIIGKLWRFLYLIKYIGFIEIIILATLTELHTIDARNLLAI